MAGHSKWQNVQHRKNAQDAKRAGVFTKLIREIFIAAKTGGSALENNPMLRSVIDKALGANMKRSTIDNAIKRGSGEIAGENYEEVRYEAYGINGTAIMLDCLTDNRRRTVSDVRYAFSKFGASLGTDGSVEYLFKKQGILSFNKVDEDKIMEIALEAGAKDMLSDDNQIDIITEPEDFFNIKDIFLKANFQPIYADIIMQPTTRTKLSVEQSERFLKLIAYLEQLDDAKAVYHNADIADEVLAQL